MFARFSPEARRVIDLAEDHARAMGRTAVGPDHLLLALLAVDDCGVFAGAGLTFEGVRALLLESTPAATLPNPMAHRARHLPLCIREILRLAFRHSALLGSRSVTPQHLALALVDDPPGEIAFVLRRSGVDADALRAQVLAHIVGLQLDTTDTVVALRRPVGTNVRDTAVG